ncbi:MAG: glycoside hydrolase family 9 protein [Bacteroidota bacterium]
MKHFTLLFLLTLSFFSFAQTTDSHIKTDQYGYRPNDVKVAIISKALTGYNAPDSYTPGTTFQVKNIAGAVVFTGSPVAWNSGNTHAQSGDKVWWFDFSTVTVPGNYYVLDVSSNVRSYEFRIGQDVYYNVLKHACRMFFYQRCNMAKNTPYADARWTDGASHRQDTACRSVTAQGNAATAKDLSGGWFDAGDFNKYVNFTYQPVHHLLEAYDENPSAFTDNFNIPESGNGIPDLLDELKWELDWLLKMQLANGSVLSKVSTLQHLSASPASADNNPRYYGAASASATRNTASMFAHASIVYRKTGNAAMITYADTLLARAIRAWNWVSANPATSNYDNAGFDSANPEQSAYTQKSALITAAAYLYAATGVAAYKTHFEANYTSIQPYQWGYWYPYESNFQSALLYYTTLSGISSTVKTNILNNCKNAVNSGNSDLYPAYTAKTDAYRAQLADQDYVWGSSQVKCNMGTILSDMWLYGVDTSKDAAYKVIAQDYIHYMHGTNAVGKSMLSNMYGEGADNSINEIYHAWFGDGTVYDNALTSPKGPPHGYVTGGINKNYKPDASYSGPVISPPQSQPVQKCYKDWNTNWPQNSWEISEPAIYYQAAYIKLLSKFVSVPVAVCAVPTAASTDSITHQSAKARWTKTTASSYQYQVGTSSTSAYSAYGISTDSTKVFDGLSAQTGYFWRVRAICGPGDTSAWSDTLYFTTLPAPVICVSPDSLFTTAITDSSATLEWIATPNATAYVVYLMQGSGTWLNYSSAGSPFLATGLVENSNYLWYVRSVCGTDTAPVMRTITFNTLLKPVPFVCVSPDSLWVSELADHSARLNWNATDSTDVYELSYAGPDGIWNLVHVFGTSHLVTGLDSLTHYTFGVQSICDVDTAALTDTLGFTTTGMPAVVCSSPDTVFVTSVSDQSATASWNAIAGSSGYHLFYREKGSAAAPASVTTADTTAALAPLVPGTEYEVWVLNSCDTVLSAPSAVTSFTTFPCDLPDPIYVVSVTDSSITFNWNKTYAYAYTIWYRKDSTQAWMTASTTDTIITITGLSAGTTYMYHMGIACASGFTKTGGNFTAGTSGSGTGIAENGLSGLKIFPNPAQEFIVIDSPRAIATLELYEVSGKLVIREQASATNQLFLPVVPGFYLLKVTLVSGETISKRIVKQ